MSASRSSSSDGTLSTQNNRLLAGGIAGAIGTVVGQPLDTIKVWLQSHPVNAPRSAATPATATAATAAPSAPVTLGAATATHAPRASTPAIAAPLPDAIGRWGVISSHLERGGPSALMHGTVSACLARFTIQAGSFSLLASFRSALHRLSPTTFPCSTCDTLRPSSPQASPLVTTFASGFLTGAVLTPITCALDLLKIQRQVQTSIFNSSPTPPLPAGASAASTVAAKPAWRGFLHFAWSTARTHGVRRLFRGMAPTAARTPLFWAVYYSAYEASIAHSNGGGFAATGTNDVSTLHNSWVVLKAGSVAGGLGWLSVFPIDMIKTRIQSQPLGAPPIYRGMVDCAASVYRNGGIAPFFRGAIALVVRGVLVNAVVFWSYEKIFKGLEHTAQK